MLRIPVYQVPFEKALHLPTGCMLIDIGDEQQSAGSYHAVKDGYQLSADFVGKVIKEAGTIDKIV